MTDAEFATLTQSIDSAVDAFATERTVKVQQLTALRRQRTRLMEALKVIMDGDPCDCEPSDWRCPHTSFDPSALARAALAEIAKEMEGENGNG